MTLGGPKRFLFKNREKKIHLFLASWQLENVSSTLSSPELFIRSLQFPVLCETLSLSLQQSFLSLVFALHLRTSRCQAKDLSLFEIMILLEKSRLLHKPVSPNQSRFVIVLDQSDFRTSFTSNKVKLRLRFTWHSPDVHLTTWPSSDLPLTLTKPLPYLD